MVGKTTTHGERKVSTVSATDNSVESFVDQMFEPQGEEETPEAPDEDQTEGEAEPEEEEADEDQDQEEAGDDEPADDEEDEGDDEEEADQEEPEALTVKVDGKDVPVTLEDLKRSYSGQAYIQKGMREAAEAKKATEAELQTIQQERAQLAQMYQALQQQGVMKQPKPPSAELAETDPISYMTERAKYEQEAQAYYEQHQQFQQLTARQTQEQQEQQKAFLAEQKDMLVRAIPELADADKAGRIQKGIVTAAKAAGYSDDELAQVQDHRALVLINKARLWDELQANKGTAPAKARKVVKPGAKVTPKASAQREREKQRQKLRKSGRVDDAIDLMFDN